MLDFFRMRRPALGVSTLLVLAAFWWTATANRGFLALALDGSPPDDVRTWLYGAGLFLAVAALQVLVAGLFAGERTVKPLLAALTLAAAGAGWFAQTYGVIIDTSMMRNVLHTDPAEARELLTPAFVLHMLLFAGVPLALLAWTRVAHRPWRRALATRAALLGGCAVLVLVVAWAAFQPLSSLIRTHREARYLVAPLNVVLAAARAATVDLRDTTQARRPIGTDARPGESWAARQRPLVLVLVVGETARADRWGLNPGSPHDTTPELRGLDVVNFPDVASCGTSTEVSVPCMFAPVGRRDYDERRIRGEQSLLHVLARAGVGVQWRDNQSGCKGVCDGLPFDEVQSLNVPGLCDGERCLDEGLVADLGERLRHASGTQVLVLHMLGAHGPSYFRRYPPAFERFTPACHGDDLHDCSVAEIRNAYDNALLYTDHVLATAVRTLRAQAADVDSALFYVADHGESLGEHNLFLHGMPYAIAPREQKRVPMVWWASAGFERAAGMRAGCLDAAMRQRAGTPVSHDHLFHTLLGALDVRTSLRESALDLTDGCRGPADPR